MSPFGQFAINEERKVIEQINELLTWIPQHRGGLDSSGMALMNTVQAQLIAIRGTAGEACQHLEAADRWHDFAHVPVPQPDRQMLSAHDDTFTP